MIDGRRITDAAMLEVVVMIYAGKSTKYIVALFTNAIGFWS
jgi:acetylglutamate kinase